MPTRKKNFREYLEKAVELALEDEDKDDGGNMKWTLQRTKRGVKKNWSDLRPEDFLAEYLWCVGGIRKRFSTRAKYYPEQMKLFRQCDAKKITRDAKKIRADWRKSKHDLNSLMFEAVIRTAGIMANGWSDFKRQYLLLPENPESELPDDWQAAYSALDSLPMVGWALAWYLMRNLYGAPFFKPDLHINVITAHFFGRGRLVEMTKMVRELWPQVCHDKRLKPVHIGVADYVLWWYRQKTGEPPEKG